MSIRKKSHQFVHYYSKAAYFHCDETLCHRITTEFKNKKERITCVKCVCRMEGWKLGDRAIQMTFHPILSISYDGRLIITKKRVGDAGAHMEEKI